MAMMILIILLILVLFRYRRCQPTDSKIVSGSTNIHWHPATKISSSLKMRKLEFNPRLTRPMWFSTKEKQESCQRPTYWTARVPAWPSPSHSTSSHWTPRWEFSKWNNTIGLTFRRSEKCSRMWLTFAATTPKWSWLAMEGLSTKLRATLILRLFRPSSEKPSRSSCCHSSTLRKPLKQKLLLRYKFSITSWPRSIRTMRWLNKHWVVRRNSWRKRARKLRRGKKATACSPKSW